MKRLLVIFLAFSVLTGCANGGSMPFEVGPNLEDQDFEEALTEVNAFKKLIVESYDYGEIKYAPVAYVMVDGFSKAVDRALVTDGGIIWVGYNMVDGQFKVRGMIQWSNVSSILSEIDGVGYLTILHAPDGGVWNIRLYPGPTGEASVEKIQKFIVSKAGESGATIESE